MNANPRGKVAVITGASSGIGAAVAHALNAEGVKVALAARREDALMEVGAHLPTNTPRIIVPTDVTSREQMKSLARRTEEGLGPLDILVNCAGVMYYTLMKNLHEDDWERTVDVVCNGTLNCIGAVLPGMLERGSGHIITISSDAGRKVFPGLSVYSGAKSFVEAVSQGLRLETAGSGLKITTIQPGNVATGLLHMSHDEEAIKTHGQPTGARVLDPEDVAATVLHAIKQPAHTAINEVLIEPRDEPV